MEKKLKIRQFTCDRCGEPLGLALADSNLVELEESLCFHFSVGSMRIKILFTVRLG